MTANVAIEINYPSIGQMSALALALALTSIIFDWSEAQETENERFTEFYNL